MAAPQYDNNGNVVKKPFKIKIAGFTFGLGHIVALALVVGIIFLVSFISSENRKKEEELRYEQKMAEIEAAMANNTVDSTATYDVHAQIQAALSERFGIAPEGFEWGYTGELVALGNDDDHTCEDVVYMFLRSLSMLDFSTASRYSESSMIIAQYQDYYDVISNHITDYYSNFLRKQFKESLTSLEVLGISDTAVFADGTEYLTVEVKILDLQDKDFWEKDRDEMFQTMRVYKDTETDQTKMEQYVYDYIFAAYENGEIDKANHTIELVVSKQSGSGWLVSGDGELNAYLQYENGVDVARYILNEFNAWYMEVTLEEQLAQIGALSGGSSSPAADGTSETDSGSGTDEQYDIGNALEEGYGPDEADPGDEAY